VKAYSLFLVTLLTLVVACQSAKKTAVSDASETEPAFIPNPRPLPSMQPNYQPSATRLIDIVHMRLDVRPDWKKRWLYGKATLTLKPYFYAINALDLDARGMDIRQVSFLTTPLDTNTNTITYTYDKSNLHINLSRFFQQKDTFSIFIDYIAKPDELTDLGGGATISSDKGLYFINPDGTVPNKPTQLWSQGETQANSVWFPTVDRPNEKMTEEIFITTEQKYVTLSNGVMMSSVNHPDGTRTDHWKMDLPHSPYLVMIAIGQFTIVKDTWRDKEVSYYVEPEFAPYARKIFGRTPEMMEFFSTRFGVDYPWSKYAQICTRDFVSGAMENTSAVIHGEFVQQTPREMLVRTYEEYISHELSHHWFGDLVTCESWGNLSLNESFATYCEYLWNEYANGIERADAEHYGSKIRYIAEVESGKKEPLIRYNHIDREDLFDSHSYNKGGQILHMLRQVLGDAAFFAGIKIHLERSRFKNAEVHNLRMAFEEASGQDLNWFFEQWFLSQGHPELDIRYGYDATRQKQYVTIKQTQDQSKGTPLYRLPLSIDIYANNSVQRHSIVVTKFLETFSFTVKTRPDLVNVDATKSLLCTKADHHTTKEWAAMYDLAPRFVDRMEAIEGITDSAMGKPEATAVLIKALNDRYPEIRITAINLLGKQTETMQQRMIDIALRDPDALARNAALTNLLEITNPSASLRTALISACSDSSYIVVSSALQALMKYFYEDGRHEAEMRENDPSRSMKLAVITCYSNYGTEDKQPWMEKAVFSLQGRFYTQALTRYAIFLNRCSDETVERAIPAIASFYASTEAKAYTKNLLLSLQKNYEAKETEIDKKISALSGVKRDATRLNRLEKERESAIHMRELINSQLAKLK
jgi:aminopeptidase N